MGIASITPLVDYSQGNDWDNWLETMDDLHKPQLDGIGYQDLMQNKMHGLAKPNLAVGKQPAWLDYMTNFNKTFADFAAGEEESYMVLNRIYDVSNEGKITNTTTYINPKDYTYIFASGSGSNRINSASISFTFFVLKFLPASNFCVKHFLALSTRSQNDFVCFAISLHTPACLSKGKTSKNLPSFNTASHIIQQPPWRKRVGCWVTRLWRR